MPGDPGWNLPFPPGGRPGNRTRFLFPEAARYRDHVSGVGLRGVGGGDFPVFLKKLS